MKKLLLSLFALSLFACSSSSDDSPTPSTAGIAYFKGSINGVAMDYTMANYTSSPFMYGYWNGTQGTTPKSFYYGCDMMHSDMSDGHIALVFENMYVTNDTATEPAAFNGLWSPMTTNFITSAQDDTMTKGISVSYQSAAGVNYGTMPGSQVGSTMTVTSITAGTEAGGSLKIQTIVGTISCKLYNWDDTNEVLTLTNGQFKLIVREAS